VRDDRPCGCVARTSKWSSDGKLDDAIEAFDTQGVSERISHMLDAKILQERACSFVPGVVPRREPPRNHMARQKRMHASHRSRGLTPLHEIRLHMQQQSKNKITCSEVHSRGCRKWYQRARQASLWRDSSQHVV
jgi:hypothetical protein